jgi:hypothetical protein
MHTNVHYIFKNKNCYTRKIKYKIKLKTMGTYRNVTHLLNRMKHKGNNYKTNELIGNRFLQNIPIAGIK